MSLKKKLFYIKLAEKANTRNPDPVQMDASQSFWIINDDLKTFKEGWEVI